MKKRFLFLCVIFNFFLNVVACNSAGSHMDLAQKVNAMVKESEKVRQMLQGYYEQVNRDFDSGTKHYEKMGRPIAEAFVDHRKKVEEYSRLHGEDFIKPYNAGTIKTYIETMKEICHSAETDPYVAED